ncbi:ankyrin repeat domain-containing protein [Mycobacterium sp. B14F4]|uniref:ankyrin repeat domain-containing protein n=1 Tax=Mycobacterium sp. B14F4 TaxID=3153565 RepID=UPI00325E3082
MTELARYRDGPELVVVSRDGGDLVSISTSEDVRSQFSESRMPIADFVARGPGPWPWFDLGEKRDGALRILDALGVVPPAWTVPLPPDVVDLFRRAERGDSSVIELLAMGADPDPVDPCGASPLWYAVRSVGAGLVVALIDAGADAGRRVELSADGGRFTTVLHEIVRLGRVVALRHALAKGIDPSLVDSGGATAMHLLDAGHDYVNPEIVRALVRAGASVTAPLPSGAQPVEQAARGILPATVAAMVELGADPARGLDALLSWWTDGARLSGYRAGPVSEVVGILRGAGAEVTERHRELAAATGASQVVAALRD